MKIQSIGWIIFFSIITFGLFCICLPILAFKGYVSIDSIIQIASVLISWPVAVTIITLLFLARFREPIDSFLRQIKSFQTPFANIQTQSQSASPDREEGRALNGGVTSSIEQTEQINRFLTNLQESHDITLQEKEGLKQELSNVTKIAYKWKFTYLNLFFAESTKQVLLWFSENSTRKISKHLYHQLWTNSIPDAKVRETMLDVAIQYDMLKSDGINLRITPEGYLFLQYIRLIPYAPPAENA